MKLALACLLLTGLASTIDGFRPSSLRVAVEADTGRRITQMSTSDQDEEINRFRSEVLGQTSGVPSSGIPKLNVGRGLLQGGVAFIALAVLENGGVPNPFAESNGYPIKGDNSIMRGKAHGTTDSSVQANLRFGCDNKLADRICSYNREGAERAGYFQYSTNFLSEVNPNEVTTYYDSVTGMPLFRAPIGRTFDEFLEESKGHGWPSFRDEEVIWDNVRAIRGGEMVSLAGTHLGHNLPDWQGNRYCINLVSVAGHNVQSKPVASAMQVPL
jgi:peptide methionine sulfoxide reductase MsrB